MTTYGQLTQSLRAILFPSGEADNLVVSHDKMFVDALIDLQSCVPCLQLNNTDIFPQCSTTYNCGLTVLACPRGNIKKLAVIDKIDPVTRQESATADNDYCREVIYLEVDFTHVRRYLDRARGGCLPIGGFFGMPFFGYRPSYPSPTDEGIPANLPPLPLGFHYPQESTDRPYGRAGAGIWAKERGNIYIAPWIQSTESVIITWDGIKRDWVDADLIDDDPLLAKAVEEYVRWQHSRKWDRDEAAAADAMAAYNSARIDLIHQCREETRVRGVESSLARAASMLYYNDAQSFTAECPSSATGNPVTVTIPASTVGSSVSVADANQKALAQAQTQATAQLQCTTLYWNTVAYTKSSQGCPVTDGAAPPPSGQIVTSTVAVGAVSSTVSVDDANTKAAQQAQDQANAQQVCTYYNSAQSFSTACPDGSNPVTGTCPAGKYNATTQSAANALALTDATNDANAQLEVFHCAPVFWNEANAQIVDHTYYCGVIIGGSEFITVSMPAHLFSAPDQLTANILAYNAAQQCADNAGGYYCLADQGTGGTHAVTYTPTGLVWNGKNLLFVP